MIRKILVGFVLVLSANLLAQRASSSPYSSFGFGESFSSNTIEQSSMGGVGVAYNNYKSLNFTNPAAYAALRFTTYSFSVSSKSSNLKGDNLDINTNATLFNHVALAFPVGKKAGFSLGLLPLTITGYSFLEANATEDTGTTIFEGDGGVNRFYGALGYQVTKQLSLGAQIESNFGNITKNIRNVVPEKLSTINAEDLDFKGLAFTLGSQYQRIIKKNLQLNVGAAVKLGYDLNVTGKDSTVTVASDGSSRDLALNLPVNATYELPIKTILGVGVGKFEKWYVGAEYEYQDKITENGFIIPSTTYKFGEVNRFSLGGFITPNIRSISSYWKRVTYRSGIKMEKTGLLIDPSGNETNFTSIDNFGISFGLGLPLKKLSTLNVGVEYGKRGTTTNNLIQENYFNFRLGLSLTDKNWFIKRKID